MAVGTQGFGQALEAEGENMGDAGSHEVCDVISRCPDASLDFLFFDGDSHEKEAEGGGVMETVAWRK